MSTEPGTTLPQADATKVRLAFAKMPYSASVRLRDGAGLTVDEVVDALNDLGEVLRRHAREHDALADQHRQLSADVRAMRRVLGTEPM